MLRSIGRCGCDEYLLPRHHVNNQPVHLLAARSYAVADVNLTRVIPEEKVATVRMHPSQTRAVHRSYHPPRVSSSECPAARADRVVCLLPVVTHAHDSNSLGEWMFASSDKRQAAVVGFAAFCSPRLHVRYIRVLIDTTPPVGHLRLDGVRARRRLF